MMVQILLLFASINWYDTMIIIIIYISFVLYDDYIHTNFNAKGDTTTDKISIFSMDLKCRTNLIQIKNFKDENYVLKTLRTNLVSEWYFKD